MKRTIAILFIAAAVGCTLAARQAAAQAPSDGISIDAAQKNFDEANSRAADLAKSILDAKDDSAAGDRQALRERLRPAVEESFNARQQLQHAQLEQLRRRLDEIEKSIKERKENKESIIKSRIEELLSAKTANRFSDLFYDEGKREFRPVPADRLPAVVPQPGPPENLPPGTERRVRYVEEQVQVNGEVKTVKRPVYEIVPSAKPNAAPPRGNDNNGFVAPPRKSDDDSTGIRGAAFAREAFDFAVRERLTHLDMEAAEEDRAAAEQDLARLRKRYEQGEVHEFSLREVENKLRQAERALKRAKATLEALALERTELAAAADADVAEAEAEVKRAEAKVEGAKASVVAALAEINRLEAEVESAKSNLESRDKVFKRLQKLVDEKAVDMTLLDEKEEQREAARAALAAAEAALRNGSALAERAKAAVTEAEQELNVAKARLRAAQARRERLMHRAATDSVGAPPSPGADAKPAASAKP